MRAEGFLLFCFVWGRVARQIGYQKNSSCFEKLITGANRSQLNGSVRLTQIHVILLTKIMV